MSDKRELPLIEVDGELRIGYVWKRYRILFGDGRVVDVHGIEDGSVFRAAVLQHFKAEQISGVTRINDEPEAKPEPEPEPKPVKKTAAKKAVAKKAASAGGVREDGADPTGTDG